MYSATQYGAAFGDGGKSASASGQVPQSRDKLSHTQHRHNLLRLPTMKSLVNGTKAIPLMGVDFAEPGMSVPNCGV